MDLTQRSSYPPMPLWTAWTPRSEESKNFENPDKPLHHMGGKGFVFYYKGSGRFS